jgi:gluconolactonase
MKKHPYLSLHKRSASMKINYKTFTRIFWVLFLSIPVVANCQQVRDTITANYSDAVIIADGAMPRLISKQFSFTEGASVDRKGNIFFTDQPNNKIWKYGTDGKLSLFLDSAGRSNGMYFDKKGNLITCADEHDELWSINKHGKVTVLLKDYEGKKLNGPNDLWIDPKGGIYFTDPYYQRSYWTRKQPEIQGEKVYYMAKGKTTAVPVIENLLQPNGIVGTPDGEYLYVADIKGKKTYKYKIREDGSLEEGQLFTDMGSDGMTIDENGNIYLTGNGVTVFNPQGKKIAHIAIPEKWTANLAFGGKNRKQLFITASTAIYIIDMKVKGVE